MKRGLVVAKPGASMQAPTYSSTEAKSLPSSVNSGSSSLLKTSDQGRLLEAVSTWSQ